MNLFFFQDAENEAILSLCSRDKVDIKTLQSDWLRTFYLESKTRFFPNMELMQNNRN